VTEPSPTPTEIEFPDLTFVSQETLTAEWGWTLLRHTYLDWQTGLQQLGAR
jgi:hypothetical protein